MPFLPTASPAHPDSHISSGIPPILAPKTGVPSDCDSITVSGLFSLHSAGKSDELKNTVNYAAVFEIVKSVVEGQRFHLIEAIAEHIADLILGRYPEVRAVEVTVHKPAAPIPGDFQDAAITIRRAQGDQKA